MYSVFPNPWNLEMISKLYGFGAPKSMEFETYVKHSWIPEPQIDYCLKEGSTFTPTFMNCEIIQKLHELGVPSPGFCKCI